MNKIVDLSRSYENPHAGQPIKSLTLEEPTYRLTHMEGLGKPQELQPNGNGGFIVVTYGSVVDAYAQRLIKCDGIHILSNLSVEDAYRLEKAICDFFTVTTRSEKLPDGSSSSEESPLTSSPE